MFQSVIRKSMPPFCKIGSAVLPSSASSVLVNPKSRNRFFIILRIVEKSSTIRMFMFLSKAASGKPYITFELRFPSIGKLKRCFCNFFFTKSSRCFSAIQFYAQFHTNDSLIDHFSNCSAESVPEGPPDCVFVKRVIR